jgi:adenylate cyclase
VLAMQSPEGNRAARSFLERAIELDPYFAEAHSWLAMANYSAWAHSGESEEIQRPLARLAAERAVSLDPNDASARAILAYVRLFEGGNLNEASVELAEALRVNPNNADAWLFFGEVKVMEGRAAEGIEDVRNAFRLNPYPPGVYYIGSLEWHSMRRVSTLPPRKHSCMKQPTGQDRDEF